MTVLRCPLCPGRSVARYSTRSTLKLHLLEHHWPQEVAAELIVRVYPPNPAACSKRKFPTETAAINALISAALSKSPNRAEKRVYHCPDCGQWHLTKKDEETPA